MKRRARRRRERERRRKQSKKQPKQIFYRLSEKLTTTLGAVFWTGEIRQLSVLVII